MVSKCIVHIHVIAELKAYWPLLVSVILDAPTGMSSDVWVLVQLELAKTTEVCVYDRAGLGLSERPPYKVQLSKQ